MGRGAIILAVSLLLSMGCSVIFDSSDEEQLNDFNSLYRYNFSETGETLIESTGRSQLTLAILGDATIEGGDLVLNQATTNIFDLARSQTFAEEARAACVANEALSIATWVTIGSITLGFQLPRRIFSIESRDDDNNSFVLGQGNSINTHQNLVVRVGSRMGIVLPVDLQLDEIPIWVFFSMESDGSYRYQVGDGNVVPGDSTGADLWDWPQEHFLTLGNSESSRIINNRTWKGRIHHLEFFCRVLSDMERTDLKAQTDPR